MSGNLIEYTSKYLKKDQDVTANNADALQHIKRQRITQLVLVVLGLLAATVLIYVTDADRDLAVLMYGSTHVWPGIDQIPWNLLYEWAPVPGFCIVGLALLVLVAGFFASSLKPWRREALFLVLLMAIGPGLIVNVALKDNLGRARPREIVECGGIHPYTEIWEIGTTGANSSFPSGHASVAFYAFAPWFILRDKKKSGSGKNSAKKRNKLAGGFLVFGILFGSAVGLARMLQGGHFLNDVLWSGGFVYLTGGVLALMLLPVSAEEDRS